MDKHIYFLHRSIGGLRSALGLSWPLCLGVTSDSVPGVICSASLTICKKVHYLLYYHGDPLQNVQLNI